MSRGNVAGKICVTLMVALAVNATAQAQPPSAPAVIETARKAALAFADSLPDFIVTRTTTRYRGVRDPGAQNQVSASVPVQAPGAVIQQQRNQNATPDWQPLDTVSGNIATEHGKEVYSNIVLNGKPAAALVNAK